MQRLAVSGARPDVYGGAVAKAPAGGRPLQRQSAASRVHGRRRPASVVVRAQVPEDDEAEARLEALERARRRGKGSGDLETELKRSTAQAMVDRESGGSYAAKWKEGELFPEGWEEMSLFEKFYNAYMGERGLLFWANKLAFGAVFVVIGAWIIFRFVGPAIGLYKLV